MEDYILNKRRKARTELRNYMAHNQIEIQNTFKVKVPLTIVNMSNGKFEKWIYQNLLNFQQFSILDNNITFSILLNKFISANEEANEICINQ